MNKKQYNKHHKIKKNISVTVTCSSDSHRHSTLDRSTTTEYYYYYYYNYSHYYSHYYYYYYYYY